MQPTLASELQGLNSKVLDLAHRHPLGSAMQATVRDGWIYRQIYESSHEAMREHEADVTRIGFAVGALKSTVMRGGSDEQVLGRIVEVGAKVSCWAVGRRDAARMTGSTWMDRSQYMTFYTAEERASQEFVIEIVDKMLDKWGRDDRNHRHDFDFSSGVNQELGDLFHGLKYEHFRTLTIVEFIKVYVLGRLLFALAWYGMEYDRQTERAPTKDDREQVGRLAVEVVSRDAASRTARS